MKQRFANHDEIPVWLVDYLLTVADAGHISELSIADINDFLEGLDGYYRDRERQDVHSDVGHDRSGISDRSH